MEIISFTLAVIVALITLGQFLTAREANRFALFEKRYAVFQAVTQFIGETISESTNPERVRNLDRATIEAYFLFGADDKVMAYLAELRKKAQEINILSAGAKDIPGPRNPERTALVNQRLERDEWFFDQVRDAKTVFAPFISFKERRPRWQWIRRLQGMD